MIPQEAFIEGTTANFISKNYATYCTELDKDKCYSMNEKIIIIFIILLCFA